ncbi:hypothetical protein LAZ67_1007093 [Cordylochernes scorpioides]|uniref:Uncharacterized protein n=1 Tax=Cordylochernes scorpioides TaxID=51811 RepID=A0ABY6K0V7_9ARAC|nr:hypothetical protein LAZ67_1007093 [Cordylochernes scorpioides]
MELCASLLLAQLTRLVCAAMSLNINKVTLWSDSTIVLTEKKVCRGPFQEVLIDKFQRREWQTGSPAGVAVKEAGRPAVDLCAEKTWQSGGRSLSGDNGTCSRENGGDNRRGKLAARKWAPRLCGLTSGARSKEGRGGTYLGRQ